MHSKKSIELPAIDIQELDQFCAKLYKEICDEHEGIVAEIEQMEREARETILKSPPFSLCGVFVSSA